MAELCGDRCLTLFERIVYLASNAKRNIVGLGPLPKTEIFLSKRPVETSAMASPGRVMTEAFLRKRLPQLMPEKRVRVLEIGCGSGSICRLLAHLGYSGEYLGIDISDRFDTTTVEGFSRRFICVDAHDFDPGDERFDLIVSVSALEHIPEEEKLIERFPNWLMPGGIDLHFVPSGWGLVAYLWHGWRQYSIVSIGRKFGVQAIVSPLGGIPSTILHIVFITVAEMLFRIQVRKRWPAIYGRLLDYCLKFDRRLPWCSTMHAVFRQATATPEA